MTFPIPVRLSLKDFPHVNIVVYELHKSNGSGDVQFAVKQNGHLRGLDGRILTSRSVHSALNLLLQSAGAVVMKKATCILWDDLTAAGFKYGADVVQVLHIHDEYQLYVRKGIEEQVGEIAVNAIRKAGDYFKFRCPLDGEYKVGANWKETH